MVKFEFRNLSDQTTGFRIYDDRFSWKSGATMIVQVADASSVSLKFQLQSLKKQVANLQDLIQLIKFIQSAIVSEFPEGSTGYSLSFIDPAPVPSIDVILPSRVMEVGDEMVFDVTSSNLTGKIVAFIKEQDVAKVLKDGRTIQAVGPGTAYLKVGTKQYNKEFPIKVEAPMTEKVEVAEVPESEGKKE